MRFQAKLDVAIVYDKINTSFAGNNIDPVSGFN